MPITDLPDLHRHLQWALQVEHTTIPPYLCALHSIPDGYNVEAATVIRSVVMEEMLHMTLVANVLNAVGERRGCMMRRSCTPIPPRCPTRQTSSP